MYDYKLNGQLTKETEKILLKMYNSRLTLEEKNKISREMKQLKLERDTSTFVARERLNTIEDLTRKKEIAELKFLQTKETLRKLKNKIKDIMFNVRNEFENEIDSYDTSGGRELTTDDINIMFEFLDNYINKVEMLIDEEEEE